MIHTPLSRAWVVLLPVLLPNLIWLIFPGRPTNQPLVPPTDPRLKSLVVLESAGRVAVLTLPFFLEASINTGFDRVLVAIGALALLVYYVGWARFFIRGRQPALLFAPLGAIQVPLAVSPVVYFLAFAGLARSLLMAVATAVFGLVHVWLSLKRVSAA